MKVYFIISIVLTITQFSHIRVDNEVRTERKEAWQGFWLFLFFMSSVVSGLIILLY
jgi:hypothetical protein